MNNSELKIQLDKIVNDLAKTNGIEGSLVVDGNGEVLSHHILQDVELELFGPMANVITSSSKRLINFANHGEIERVLVESKRGKALFLHLGNVHFIVLMQTKANVGMIMISSKRASQQIIDLTEDLTPIQLEEKIAEPAAEELEVEETRQIFSEELSQEEKIPESSPPIEEQSEQIKVEVTQKETIESQDATAAIDKSEELLTETETPTETITETETITKEPEVSIPVIKPPIAFPKLDKVVKIPEDEAERVDLILKIYESIFRAMSIGASKIMGVAPARGLTRKFLPVEQCKMLLDGVDIKSNSTIDFVKIRENAEKIPLHEREESFKESFGKIITIITKNYGKVMGYAAFRAMIRPEFKIINESYGHLLADLGIKDQLHPELRDFFS